MDDDNYNKQVQDDNSSDAFNTHGNYDNPSDSRPSNSDHISMMQQYNYMNYYNYGYYNYPGYDSETTDNSILENVQRCHMHKKPDLNCKFCRKYKSAVHEISRLAQQQLSQPAEGKRNQIPMTNTTTYNMNNLLRNNILSSEYYKSLFSMQTFQEVVDELIQYGTHAEPYCSTATKAPSTLFCCLYKFFTMKLTEKQMSTLLNNIKSPYPRCCGFLYLRYVLPSDKLWTWFEPYFLDDELVIISADQQKQVTIGEYAETLLMDDKYFNIVLPRLPVRIKNLFGAQLLEMDSHRKRRITNLDIIDDFYEGASVSACSKGDWLDGEIVQVKDGKYGYPLVTVLLEDGTEETLDIGYVSLKNKSTSHKRSDGERHTNKSRRDSSEDSLDRHLKYRSRVDNPSKRLHDDDRNVQTETVGASKDDLIREFKRREREKVLAVGKGYARRPTSYKSSLSSRLDAKHERSNNRNLL